MAKNTDKKYRLFDEGASVLRELGLVSDEGRYACPICGRLFVKSAIDEKALTLEHIPPDWAGGKDIALTCRECNVTYGSRFDAALKDRMAVYRAARAIYGSDGVVEDVDIVLEHQDIELNARIDAGGGAHGVRFPEQTNNPEDRREFFDYLRMYHEKGAWEGIEYTITLKQTFCNWKSEVGYLRAAFLLGFARWGYSFALHHANTAIRDQLRNTDKQNLKGFLISSKSEIRPGIGRLDAPIRCTAASVLDKFVLLPPPNVDSYSFYESLEARFPRGEVDLRYTMRDYPNELEYEADRNAILRFRDTGKTPLRVSQISSPEQPRS